jgi:hypothetical protein
MVMHRALREFFTALRAAPAGNLAGQTRWASTFEEYTGFVGLPAYRALEDRYLPKAALDTKYAGGREPVIA